MGTHWGNIRLYRGYMANMETKMDTTVWGLGFRGDSLSGTQLDHGSCLAICLPFLTLSWIFKKLSFSL